MDVEATSIMLLDEAGGEYRIVEARNLSREATRVRFLRGKGAAGWVEREGRPLFIQAAGIGSDRQVASTIQAGEELRRIRAVVCIPLMVGEKVIGLLNLGERRSDVPYYREDLEMLLTMGRSAAMALENARLHEERVRILRQHIALVTAAQEDERKRIARELHDGLSPFLASVNIRLKACQRLLRKGVSEVDEELEGISQLVKDNNQDIRCLIYELRPAALDQLGLVPALREYVRRYQQENRIAVELTVFGDEERLLPAVELALFRVVQEALNNVAKHAQARRVEIKLERGEGEVRVSIADDGRGFVPQEALRGTGLGLLSMRERVEYLGGRFELESAPGEGTKVRAIVPLEEKYGEDRRPDR
jgi:signal transduction histidine kinase